MRDRVWLWSPQNRSATSEHFPSLQNETLKPKNWPRSLSKADFRYDTLPCFENVTWHNSARDGRWSTCTNLTLPCQLWSVLVLGCDDCLHAERTLCPTFSRWRSEGWNYSHSCPASLRWRGLNRTTGSRTAWRMDVMQCRGHLAIREVKKGLFAHLPGETIQIGSCTAWTLETSPN